MHFNKITKLLILLLSFKIQIETKWYQNIQIKEWQITLIFLNVLWKKLISYVSSTHFIYYYCKHFLAIYFSYLFGWMKKSNQNIKRYKYKTNNYMKCNQNILGILWKLWGRNFLDKTWTLGLLLLRSNWIFQSIIKHFIA
jgi:hypothetical protein